VSHSQGQEQLQQAKNAVEKEKEFLEHEQNTKELQLSDLRSKLKKRGEELQALKDGLNS
jgi:peptidoglycan hydrolase CwlO-like protein